MSMSTSTSSSSSAQSFVDGVIKVFCRLKPRIVDSQGSSRQLQYFDTSVDDSRITYEGKEYSFSKVFKENASQEKVYSETVKFMAKDVLNGYNCTVFTYGQISSGKTFTMEGAIGDDGKQGIIPRVIQDIFNQIYSMDENSEFYLKCSYYEIYLEKIRDLLDMSKDNLSVYENKRGMPYVKGVTEVFATSPDEMIELVELGKANRRNAATTNLNEQRSRSHSVFLISVHKDDLINHKTYSGKLHLVDLAGRENVSKSGAQGQALQEAKKINMSLSALGNVVWALTQKWKSHIPYRDSKLTRILQESLEGNARIAIIICCSAESANTVETKTTLEFGRKANAIKNVVIANEEPTPMEWKRMYEREKERVSQLEGKLERCSQEENADSVNSEVSKQQCQQIQNLRGQLAEKDEIISTLQLESDKLQQEIMRLQSENMNEKEKVKEIQQLLEKVALNYDQKCSEAEVTADRLEVANSELEQKQTQLTATVKEMQQLKDDLTRHLKKTNEMLIDLLRALKEIGQTVGSPATRNIDTRGTLATFNVPKVMTAITEMKADVKKLAQKCQRLESSHTGCSKNVQMDGHKKSLSREPSRVRSKKEQETEANQKPQQLDLKPEGIRIQAQQELNGLSEAVTRQIETFVNLKKMFVKNLQNHMNMSVSGINATDADSDSLDYTFGGALVDKQKISFLETNLDELTKVHKQLVRDNADLRCELPKLEKRLRATMERVKALEAALREAKEGAKRDRTRYQREVDRIKQASKQSRSLIRKGHAAQIAAPPIRGGQPSFVRSNIPVEGCGGGGVSSPPENEEECLRQNDGMVYWHTGTGYWDSIL